MHGYHAGRPTGGIRGKLSLSNIATIAAVVVLLVVLLVSLFGSADDGEPKTVIKIEAPSAVDGPSSTAPALAPVGEKLTAANGAVISDPDLLEASPEGPLPRIAGDWRKPMDVYAKPADRSDPRPKIAIIVGGLGLGAAPTQAAVDRLPAGVTLAFTPYGSSLQGIVSTARANGHEVLLEVPLEPFDYPNNDPGQNTLLTGAQGGDNATRLHWVMSRVAGYAGLINSQGAKYLTSPPDVKFLLGEASRRGLYVVDSGQTEQSIARDTAAQEGAPFVQADVQIDANPTREAMEKQFAALETLAKQRGAAVGIAAALPVTTDRVLTWASSLEQKGIALVPVSALIDAGPAAAPAPAVSAPPVSQLPSNTEPAFETPSTAPPHP